MGKRNASLIKMLSIICKKEVIDVKVFTEENEIIFNVSAIIGNKKDYINIYIEDILNFLWKNIEK